MEPPLLVDWSFTSRCNLACPFCRGYSHSELDRPRALGLAAEIAALRPPRVILEGGEPFLRDDLPDVVEILHDAGVPVTIFTNGTAVNLPWLERWRDGSVEVAVSVDADRPALYETLRPGADQSVVWRTIEALLDGGWLANVVITVSTLNRDDVFAVIARARRTGVPGVSVIPVKPSPNYESIRLSPRHKADLYRQLAFYRAETGYPIFVDEPFFEPRFGDAARAPGGAVAAPAQGCIFGRYLFIDADGNVAPCTFADFRVGSVRASSLASLWEALAVDPRVAPARDRPAAKGNCATCPDLARCGGCRVVSAAASGGDFTAADPNCPRNWGMEGLV